MSENNINFGADEKKRIQENMSAFVDEFEKEIGADKEDDLMEHVPTQEALRDQMIQESKKTTDIPKTELNEDRVAMTDPNAMRKNIGKTIDMNVDSFNGENNVTVIGDGDSPTRLSNIPNQVTSTISVEIPNRGDTTTAEKIDAPIKATKPLGDETHRTPIETETKEVTPDESIPEEEVTVIKHIPNRDLGVSNKGYTMNEFLKNLKVDLNNIDVVDSDPMTKTKNVQFLLNNKSKTQVVALQSGYISYVEGFNFDQINALVNSTLDDYGNQLLLCQSIYSAINTTNAGKMDFRKWCENTSFYDLDSFIYGVYLETFPGTTKFDVKCGTCGKQIEATVNNDTLIKASNDDSKNILSTILAHKNNPKETMMNSIIHTSKKIFLEDSKMILRIKLPTIQKHLDLLASINAKAKEKNQHILTILLFLEELYMLDLDKSLVAGSPKYNIVADREEQSAYLKRMTYNDAKHVSDEINNMIRKYQVEFQIRSFKCSACGSDIGNIPIDIEQLLFFRMSE